jgi:hypothetical protein
VTGLNQSDDQHRKLKHMMMNLNLDKHMTQGVPQKHLRFADREALVRDMEERYGASKQRTC